ncbi:hypothetical protein PMAYCL1PPCAC_16918, partial [Pristionchus mayeri]
MDALPQNKADPPIRAIFHAISLSTQLITGPCELLLAIERIISSIEPDKYYRLSLSWKVNFCAKRYCNRRYIQLHCKATLNGRYQVKEAADLATSLQKVYSFSILLRVRILPKLVLTISSLYVVIGFIRIHPRLYRKFEILLQRIRGAPVTIISHSDAFVAQERTGEGDVYFETLMKNWNETMS